jgi:hypothetical protein
MKREAGTDSAACRHILSIDFQDELWTNATEPFASHHHKQVHGRGDRATTRRRSAYGNDDASGSAMAFHGDASKMALKCGNI